MKKQGCLSCSRLEQVSSRAVWQIGCMEGGQSGKLYPDHPQFYSKCLSFTACWSSCLDLLACPGLTITFSLLEQGSESKALCLAEPPPHPPPGPTIFFDPVMSSQGLQPVHFVLPPSFLAQRSSQSTEIRSEHEFERLFLKKISLSASFPLSAL